VDCHIGNTNDYNLQLGNEVATAVTYNKRQLHFFQSAVTGVYITSPNAWYKILTSILTHNLIMYLIYKLGSQNSGKQGELPLSVFTCI
jgi:hypothetical protein